MVSPWRRKNCGRKITKPKIRVLIVISTQEPTIKRCNSGGLSMSEAATCGTWGGTTTGGSGLDCRVAVPVEWLIASCDHHALDVEMVIEAFSAEFAPDA